MYGLEVFVRVLESCRLGWLFYSFLRPFNSSSRGIKLDSDISEFLKFQFMQLN